MSVGQKVFDQMSTSQMSFRQKQKVFDEISANQISVGQMVFDQKMRYLQKWTLKTFNKVLTSKTFDQRLDYLRRFNPLDFYQRVQCSSK